MLKEVDNSVKINGTNQISSAPAEKERTVTGMAKYIDREALIEWLKRIPLIDLSDGRGLCRVIMEDDFKRAIKKIPKGIIVDVTHIDAIEVIHCHECIGKSTWINDPKYGCAVCAMSGMYPKNENGYCSYAIRKDNKK